ncbi:hypothetical protein N0V90_001701 [Kalmusia sp. IMI 367209]|nr:hypothetical protein N0V90_001701 [Kalmusia sp. IMI 367209]
MALGWLPTYRYSRLQSNDSDSYKAPSRLAVWMSSRRMRTLFLLASIAIFLFAISSFTDVPSRIQDFSPQDVYGSFRDHVESTTKATLSPSPTPGKNDSTSQPSPTKKPNSGSGQPKETGNEPEIPDGTKPGVASSKPRPPVKQPSETGNEPVISGEQPPKSKSNELKIGDKPTVIQESETSQPQRNQTETQTDEVNWSSFAYVQYVTNSNYLCNSLMILEALHRLGTKAERIMMYPEQWKIPETSDVADEEARFLIQARDQYKAKLVPIQVVTFEDRGDQTWKDSYTKLLAFNQTQYKRVISLDSDAIVKQTMDELFLLPTSPVAMPRAYWLDQPFLSSQILVIEPSSTEWSRIARYMSSNAKGGFDMDILNTLYKNSALIIPHRRYDLLTAEFRREPDKHEPYLGTKEKWNGTAALEEAKFVHFSDWPLRKPWLKDEAQLKEEQPKCVKVGEKSNCTDRDIWLGFYKDYSVKRKVSRGVALLRDYGG